MMLAERLISCGRFSARGAHSIFAHSAKTLEAIRTMCRMMQEFFDHAARGVK
jgi:hypothetical protein